MSANNGQLTEFEASLVALGISAACPPKLTERRRATAFSLPKSVGALYGLAFARAEPLGFLICSIPSFRQIDL